jgi:hypothetical protein
MDTSVADTANKLAEQLPEDRLFRDGEGRYVLGLEVVCS